MSRHVRGALFVDYVRIIRAFKEVPWEEQLPDEDLVWLNQEVEPEEWYPMASYERMGLAIMDRIAGGSLALVRRWGRDTVRSLHGLHPHLIDDQDPQETFRRFGSLTATLFDFPALESKLVRDGQVLLEIDYGMSPRAEEAACHQSLGFIEKLLELSGAEKIIVEPVSRSWAGDDKTVVSARWRPRW